VLLNCCNVIDAALCPHGGLMHELKASRLPPSASSRNTLARTGGEMPHVVMGGA